MEKGRSKVSIFNRYNLFTRTSMRILIITVIIGVIFLIFIDYIGNEHTRTLEHQKLLQLKQLVEMAKNAVNPILSDYRDGLISKDEAMTSIRNVVRRMTFTDDYGANYIFMSSYDGQMLVQPYQRQLEMTDQWDLIDENGVYIIRELIDMAIKHPEGGFVSYYYYPPDRTKAEEKISYVMGIPELRCYIGSGHYMGNIRAKQRAFRLRVFSLGAIMLSLLFILIIATLKEISMQNKRLEQEIKIRKESEHRLRDSKEKLFVKNTELENYLYIVGHDLRSPLVNIQGFTHTLQEQIDSIYKILESCDFSEEERSGIDDLIKDSVPDSFRFIFKNVTKMERLINAILEISRIGIKVANPQRIDVENLIVSIVRYLNNKYDVQAGVNISHLSDCFGDEQLISKLFFYILDNAFKYSDCDRGIVIDISSEVGKDVVIYSLRDKGIGIPQRHQEKVWNMFYRGEFGLMEDGDGIGLSIAKQIVHKNYGQIWFESVEHEGTVFYVELRKSSFPDIS